MNALQGIRVLDLGQNITAPTAAMMLADLGADVIKIERPEGDNSRTGQPFAGRDDVVFASRAAAGERESVSFLKRNRGKRGLVADLTTAEGRRLVRALVPTVDVVVSNFRPGVLAKLGLDYAALRALNERVILCAISGFGQTGPYRDWAAYDSVIQAVSGVVDHTGYPEGPPVRAGFAVADSVGSLYAVVGILAALQNRHRTGRGEEIDVSMLDALVSILWDEPLDCMESAGYPPRGGNGNLRAAPWNMYPTSDGHAFICALTAAQWRALSRLMGREWPAEFDDVNMRHKCSDEVNAAVAAFSSTMTKRELAELLQANGVPCGPVLSRTEVLEDPHVKARGVLGRLRHPAFGDLAHIATPLFPVLFSSAEGRPQAARPAPSLGQHNAEISEELGLGRAAE